MDFIKAGYGYHVQQDFNRASVDTPITIIERCGFEVIGYINGDYKHRLGFMRYEEIKVRTTAQAIETR